MLQPLPKPVPTAGAAWLVIALLACLQSPAAHANNQSRPNILWIVAEDINPQLGCYGDTNAITPNLDKLATRGLRYSKCWSVAPVCAPARTALITGMYPSSVGGEHMRSEVRLPAFIKLYPQLLAEAGYYCVNRNKEDYNVIPNGKVWAESSPRAHYKNRKPGQPFFAAINIEITHESQIRSMRPLRHEPASMRLPAYHPDLPEVREDWARYYDNITAMDAIAGRHFQELADLGLQDDTIVFFYGDNGGGMPRNKRWPYNSGLHVPLIIHVPEKWKHLQPADYREHGVSHRMVSFVDFAPTLLSLAGLPTPPWMHGQAFMGARPGRENTFLFGQRGRMDERIDCVRSATDGKYVYVRNYMPHRIYGQYLEYMFQTPTTRLWKEQYDKGALRPPQTSFWEPKPYEELYDVSEDADEAHNLANAPAHRATLSKLRAALDEHSLAIYDTGLLSEAEMHARAGKASVYEMATNSRAYPIAEVKRYAELAASMEASATPALVQACSHQDSGVRYWAAMGLLMRGIQGIPQTRSALSEALKDASPSVRIPAAEALAEHGTPSEREAALAVLKNLASPAENGPYIAVQSLNAIANLGPKAAPLHEFLKRMPVKAPAAPARANSYVERLVKDITGPDAMK